MSIKAFLCGCLKKDAVIMALFVPLFVILIFIFPPQILFLMPILFLVLLIINFNFSLIIVFVVLAIPITRFPVISEYVGQLKISIFFVVFLAWLLKKKAQELYDLKNNPLTVFCVLATLLLTINIFFSTDKMLTLPIFFSHLIEFGFFYLFLDTFRDKKRLFSLLYVLLATGVFTGFVGIMQFLIYRYSIFPQLGAIFLPYVDRFGINLRSTNIMDLVGFSGYRSVGTFYHPNMLGLYLSMVMPMALALMLIKKASKEKAILLISIIVMFVGILCAGSRSAFLSILISSSFIVIFLLKHVSKVEIILFISATLIIIIRFFDKIIYYLRLYDILSYRDLIWSNALKMISLHPLAGIGLGVFHKEYIARFGLPSLPDFETTINEIAITGSSDWLRGFHAHNFFLNYAAELGLFAIPVFLLFYIIFFSKFLSAFKLKESIVLKEYAIIVGSSSVMAANLVHGFFEAEVNFFDFSIGIAFVMIASMGISLVLSCHRSSTQLVPQAPANLTF